MKTKRSVLLLPVVAVLVSKSVWQIEIVCARQKKNLEESYERKMV